MGWIGSCSQLSSAARSPGILLSSTCHDNDSANVTFISTLLALAFAAGAQLPSREAGETGMYVYIVWGVKQRYEWR